MINTDEIRVEADNLEGGGDPVAVRLAGILRDAADEIDAGRNARLVQYRCALLSGNAPWFAKSKGALDAAAIEADAHAMLAAERPVKP